MENKFSKVSYKLHNYSEVIYTDNSYEPKFPVLNSFDIMVLRAFCKVTPCKAIVWDETSNKKRRAIVIDYENDFPYLIQKDAGGLFLYSHRTHVKIYINLSKVVIELVKRFTLKGALDLLSEYLSDGIVEMNRAKGEITFSYKE